MNGAYHRLFKQITVALMICIMGTLLLNKAFFVHTHVLADGTVSSHAHPFDRSAEKESEKSHQHSSAEFMLLHHLGMLYFVALTSASLVMAVSRINKGQPLPIVYFSNYNIPNPGRAPPRM